MKMFLIGLKFDVATRWVNVSLKLSNNTSNLCVIVLCIVNPKLYPNVSTNVTDEERALWIEKL
jgi:hypothetical protein